MQNLYDEVNDKLTQVNCVQLRRGTDTQSYCYGDFRWMSQRNGIKSYLQQYQLRDLICSIPHESRRKGSMLVVTEIDPSVRAE